MTFCLAGDVTQLIIKEVKVGMSDGIKIVIKDGVDGKAKVRGAEKKDK